MRTCHVGARSGLRALGLLACAAGTSACENPTEPDWTPPDVRPWVTDEVLDRVDENGWFVLPEPESPGEEPIISLSFAGELALGWVRTWPGNPNAITPAGLGSIARSLEERHGRPIDWGDLQLERRVAYYAITPYEPLPDTVPLVRRRFWGPHYIVPLYSEGVQAIALAVAAYATDLSLDDKGYVVLPTHAGNEFISSGVPWNLSVTVPLWPEQAAKRAAEATGARVTKVPRLIQPGQRWFPQASRWELVLDRPVTVKSRETGARRSTRTVYLGVTRADTGPTGDTFDSWVEWWVAAPEQPGVDTTRGDDVPVRPGIPILFEQVEPGG